MTKGCNAREHRSAAAVSRRRPLPSYSAQSVMTACPDWSAHAPLRSERSSLPSMKVTSRNRSWRSLHCAP